MFRKTSAIGSNGEFQFFGLFFIYLFDIISEAQKYMWSVSYIQYGTYLRVYNSHRKSVVLLQMKNSHLLEWSILKKKYSETSKFQIIDSDSSKRQFHFLKLKENTYAWTRAFQESYVCLGPKHILVTDSYCIPQSSERAQYILFHTITFWQVTILPIRTLLTMF